MALGAPRFGELRTRGLRSNPIIHLLVAAVAFHLFGDSRERSAVVSLIAARIMYAVNWLNIGPIFVLMETTLNAGLIELGAVTSSFYIGVGLFQVPAGILAARYGPKKVVVTGMMVFSLAAIGVSLSTTVLQVAVFRFIVGAGMAFVFAPAVVLVGRFFGGERIGVGVGIFNSAFDVGGLLGLYAWTLIATAMGWQLGLGVGGVLGVLTGLLVIKYVPGDPEAMEFKVKTSSLTKILKDRELILLGLGTLGLDAGNILVSGFMAYYLNRSLGVPLDISALVAAVVYVVPIVTSFWGGRLYDVLKRPKRLMILANLWMTAALILTAVPSLPVAALSTAIAGVASGVGFTVTFAWAKDLNTAERDYDGLAIAWVNSISLFGSFVPPIVFSYLAGASGYPVAWLGGGAICLLLTAPLFLQREGGRVRAA